MTKRPPWIVSRFLKNFFQILKSSIGKGEIGCRSDFLIRFSDSGDGLGLGLGEGALFLLLFKVLEVYWALKS